jgi:aminoglycoside 3-N-acetyltransferase I
MTVAVRQLGNLDLASMRAMLEMFAEAFEDPASYGGAKPGDAYLGSLLARSDFVALAAYESGTVVGGLAAYVLQKFEQERSEIYVYDLAVAATHRRRGIATALLDALRNIAAERGASVIFVQADHGDEPAIALYSRLGTRAEVLHFDIAPAARES